MHEILFKIKCFSKLKTLAKLQLEIWSPHRSLGPRILGLWGVLGPHRVLVFIGFWVLIEFWILIGSWVLIRWYVLLGSWVPFFRYANYFPANIFLFKVNNRNTRKKCETCSKLTIKTPELDHWRRCVFIVNFGYISHLFLIFLLLTLIKQMLAGLS